MLAGSARVKLDDKWRFVLPVKFRADAGAVMHFAKGDQGQLQLLTAEAYQVEVDRHLAAFAEGRDPDRWAMRMFMETVESVDLDSQSRVPVIDRLRGYASLRDRGELQLIGMFDRLEVWDLETYERRRAEVRGEGAPHGGQ
jgi:division/cell wall cluster transcriptional repressor MraZ